MGINDAITIIDTLIMRLVQVGLDVDVALMIGGVSLYYYVITIRLSIL